MAREFSKAFYKTKEWQKVRQLVYERDKGLCQDCYCKGKLTVGKEVHHIVFLTPENINDPSITLGEDNLVLLCKECHSERHNRRKNTVEGLMFDEEGNLIENYTPPLNKMECVSK